MTKRQGYAVGAVLCTDKLAQLESKNQLKAVKDEPLFGVMFNAVEIAMRLLAFWQILERKIITSI